MLSSSIDQDAADVMASIAAQGPTQGWTSFSNQQSQETADQQPLGAKDDDSYKLFVGQVRASPLPAGSVDAALALTASLLCFEFRCCRFEISLGRRSPKTWTRRR